MLAALLALTALSADAPSVAAPRPWAPSARAVQASLGGRVLAPSCRQGQCVWLRVGRVEGVAANPHGELRRVVARRGTSVHPDGSLPSGHGPGVRVAWERRDRPYHVFCSRERPAFAFDGGGGRHVLHYLDLFSLAGYQLSSATHYLRFCHDRAFDPEDQAALRRLGYRPGTRNDQVEDGAPEDLARF